jgi:hypothetical protein
MDANDPHGNDPHKLARELEAGADELEERSHALAGEISNVRQEVRQKSGEIGEPDPGADEPGSAEETEPPASAEKTEPPASAEKTEAPASAEKTEPPASAEETDAN